MNPKLILFRQGNPMANLIKYQMVDLCLWLQRPSKRYLLPEKVPSQKDDKTKRKASLGLPICRGKRTAPRSASTSDRRKDLTNYYHGSSGDGSNKGLEKRIKIKRVDFDKRSRPTAASKMLALVKLQVCNCLKCLCSVYRVLCSVWVVLWVV